MSALLELLHKHLDNVAIRELGEQIDADEALTRKALKGALPVLLASASYHMSTGQQNASAFCEALDRDHDGSLLANLDDVLYLSAKGGGVMGDASTDIDGGYTVDPVTVDGDGIMDHVLADLRPAVELGISRTSDLNVKKVNRLMAYLSPIVMGALGKIKQERQLTVDGVMNLLDDACTEIEQAVPELGEAGLRRVIDVSQGRDGALSHRVEAVVEMLVRSDRVQDKLFSGLPRSGRRK